MIFEITLELVYDPALPNSEKELKLRWRIRDSFDGFNFKPAYFNLDFRKKLRHTCKTEFRNTCDTTHSFEKQI